MPRVTSAVDLLPTSASDSESDLPEPSDPLPCLVFPWGVETPTQIDIDEPVAPDIPNQVQPVVPDQQHQTVTLPKSAPDVTTRYGCRVRCPLFFGDAHANSAFLHTFSTDQSDEFFTLLQNDKCSAEPHPFAFAIKFAISMAVSSDPDTMTLRKALQQPDRHEFIKAMEKELRDHINRKHWKVVPLKSIPVGKHAIPMVWSM